MKLLILALSIFLIGMSAHAEDSIDFKGAGYYAINPIASARGGDDLSAGVSACGVHLLYDTEWVSHETDPKHYEPGYGSCAQLVAAWIWRQQAIDREAEKANKAKTISVIDKALHSDGLPSLETQWEAAVAADRVAQP